MERMSASILIFWNLFGTSKVPYQLVYLEYSSRSPVSYTAYIWYTFFFLTLVKLYWILSWRIVSEKNINETQQDELRWKSMNSSHMYYRAPRIDLQSNVTRVHCKQTSEVMLYTTFLVIKYRIEPNNVYFPGPALLQCKLVTYIIYVYSHIKVVSFFKAFILEPSVWCVIKPVSYYSYILYYI